MKRKPLVRDKNSTILINDRISSIADEIYAMNFSNIDNGLLSGITGISVFCYYYSRFSGYDKYEKKAVELLDLVFERINNGFVLHTYCSGIAGIGWAIEHLANEGFIEMENTNILEGFDNFLFNILKSDIKHGNYDYLHGAIGTALYFSNTGNKKKKSIISDFLEELDKNAVKENGSVKWTSVTNSDKGIEGVNMGLSHGMASIIAFLAINLKKGICLEKSELLLSGAVNFMFDQQQDLNKYMSYFPNNVEPGLEGENSRMAWCYGDPGIAWALYLAGLSSQNEEIKNKAVEILLHSAKRKNHEKNMIFDAGICHGTAGLALIFMQAWRYTGIDTFMDTAKYWIECSLKMNNHENSYAGYSVWHGDKGWNPEAGILEGISGIGMMLMEVLSEDEGPWLQSILLSPL